MTERPIIFSAESVRAAQRDRDPKTQTRRVVDLTHLRVKVRAPGVVSEMPLPTGKPAFARPGIFPATLNQHGAVCAVLADGTKLGLKPGEFDFLCPYVTGKTHLGDYGGGRKVWTITPDQGSRLLVKEMLRRGDSHDIVYDVDGTLASQFDTWPWKRDRLPARFMPHALARYRPLVVTVRLEPLQDITEEDARAEGVEGMAACTREDVLRVLETGEEARSGVTYREPFRAGWDRINAKRGYPWANDPWVFAITFRRAP